MVFLEGGTFTMGTDLPIFVGDGEAPARRINLSPFYLDVHEVSNAKFAHFVAATGHRTEAKVLGDFFVMENFLSESTKEKVTQVVRDAPWWLPVSGADWRHPAGPDSTAEEDHPEVHVSWNNAGAFFGWAGKRLPT
jgi:sulfatase modifying factor 1